MVIAVMVAMVVVVLMVILMVLVVACGCRATSHIVVASVVARVESSLVITWSLVPLISVAALTRAVPSTIATVIASSPSTTTTMVL